MDSKNKNESTSIINMETNGTSRCTRGKFYSSNNIGRLLMPEDFGAIAIVTVL